MAASTITAPAGMGRGYLSIMGVPFGARRTTQGRMPHLITRLLTPRFIATATSIGARTMPSAEHCLALWRVV